ncbi:MAG: Nif3-like dinuclear metal center hexameric protein [Clostridia bacterium]|nr:Nif3-like dinuclear metal center hexameric protein [Clostridia bacterium]
MKVSDIVSVMEKYAPPALAEGFDNVGLMVGEMCAPVTTVLLSLDVGMEVAVEAKAVGAECIISHHPLLFDAPKQITDETPQGRLLLYLIQNRIAVYSAHTNLDSVSGGLNDLAANMLGLKQLAPIIGEAGEGLGRIGQLPAEMTVSELADQIKNLYKLPCIRYSGDGNKKIASVALCTGGGGSLVKDAIAKNCEVYISGDISYGKAREAHAAGMAIIELGHYESECIVVDLMEKILTDFGHLSPVIYKSRANKNIFTVE